MQQSGQQSQVCVPVSGNRLPVPSSRGAFVVNLCSSGTPVVLTEPQHPELKKFTFFVSRRREDGRERFRLHMGYFASQQDADAILEAVRDIYPGAWAGIAPGRKPPESVAVPTPPAVIHAEPVAALPLAVPAVPAPASPAPAAIKLQDLVLELEPEPVAKVVQAEQFATEQSLSSVRAAIASLEDANPVSALSSTQTLKLLEAPALTPPPALSPPPLAPEATAAYAVQLRWSMQPIGMSELPPLAIFDAYTLYRAKGRHEGSTWHALRLGFFNDLVSANQVAGYIRPEFADVSVVPVGSAERDSALDAATPRVALPASTSPPPVKPGAVARLPASNDVSEFKLIEDHTVAQPLHGKLEMMLTTDDTATPAPASPRGAGKARRPPANLEETLDVLGAGNLRLDGGKGEMLDASGVRRMRHAADRKTPPRSALSRLFDRLSERIGGGR